MELLPLTTADTAQELTETASQLELERVLAETAADAASDVTVGVCTAISASSSPNLRRLSSLTLDERSPRFLRRLQALESPSKRHWTPVQCLCSEFTTTEVDYVADVTRLLNGLLDPVGALMHQPEHGLHLPALVALRDAAHVILRVHRELLQQLESPELQVETEMEVESSLAAGRSSLQAVTRVTRAFSTTIDYMKVYALYCASFVPALAELETPVDALQQLVRAFESGGSLGDSFISLDSQHSQMQTVTAGSELIKPVQRLCLYSLLFRSLVHKASVPEEKMLLQQTLEQVQRASDLVNARVRDAENNARLVQLHESVERPKRAAKLQLLRPGRTLLAELPATVQRVGRGARLARALHLPLRRQRRLRRRELLDSVAGNDALGNSSVLDLRESPCSCDAGETKCLHGLGGAPQRLVLLSDALLLAKNGAHRLRVRQQLCLSCLELLVPGKMNCCSDGGSDCSCVRSFALVATRIGRCSCHTRSPSTLQRPARVHRSFSVSSSLASVVDRPLNDRAAPSSEPGQAVQLSPRRAARQIVVRCESEHKKVEFLALLRDAVARAARTGGSSRSLGSLSAARLPGKLWSCLKKAERPLAAGCRAMLRQRRRHEAGDDDAAGSEFPAERRQEHSRLLHAVARVTSGAA